MKVVALAGGVGGAKLADGFYHILNPDDLCVIVNTGDDIDLFGLHISPDLDTVCYTLAGLANPTTGWGLRDETWNVIGAVERLGGPTWFNLGDRDLGTDLERTRRLHAGERLSQVTREFCQAWGIRSRVLPMTDQPVATIVRTQDSGDLTFQEYFVHRRCEPAVSGFYFSGIEAARPAEGVIDAIQAADVVVLCPSNPWVSIDPILSIPGIQESISQKIIVAVSPIIGGKAVKGPAAKMFSELGIEPTALAVAQHYRQWLSGFVIDRIDHPQIEEISRWGIMMLETDTLMTTAADRCRLAEEVLNFCEDVIRRQTSK
jgi:LPPG:FO 2-phospho-L-lactate transferase